MSGRTFTITLATGEMTPTLAGLLTAHLRGVCLALAGAEALPDGTTSIYLTGEGGLGPSPVMLGTWEVDR